MDPVVSAVLGIAFLLLGIANTFFMYHLWGYPFDKETRTSAAPRPLMLAHRAIGYLFAALYVLMLWWMAPRLWNYQVEFAPRTVVHIVLGMGIGFLLLIKISIMRFFRHLEEWMPYLGTGISLGVVVLVGLSAPFAFRERALAALVEGGDALSSENRTRVEGLLIPAGFPAEAQKADLSGEESLRSGRRVLLQKCARCHDLKTVLGRPRAPDDWLRTVTRMAEKPALFEPIAREDAWRVTAYLIAITPDLQRSAKRLRQGEVAATHAGGLLAILEEDPGAHAEIDPAEAAAAFKRICSQCHTPLAVDDAKPSTREAVKQLIERMIRNGLSCSEKELRLVHRHLLGKYVRSN